MSTITLLYGQCGNQVGKTLYDTILEDINSINPTNKKEKNVFGDNAIKKWFRVLKSDKFVPRSILVDTENKAATSSTNDQYLFKHIIAKSFGGSGNNWALGYSTKSNLLVNEVLNSVRFEVEKCDKLSNLLNIYSSSGGTGSGVGCKIIEALRTEYPNKNIINTVILPFSKGEIVTQGYNTILSLSRLYTVADCNVIFENDRLQYICNNNLAIRDVKLSLMNDIIAQQLCSIYQPLSGISGSELLTNLTAHPSYKFLLIKSGPHVLKENIHYEQSYNWKNLINLLNKQNRYELQQQQNSGIKINKKIISNAVISRGTGKLSETDIKQFRDSDKYVTWLSAEDSCKYYHQQRKFNKYERYLTMISNTNNVYFPINSIVEDAWNMFSYKAHLHHYMKYGIDEEFFLESFQNLENILSEYKNV